MSVRKKVPSFRAKSSLTFCYRAANQFPSLAAALYQWWNQRWNQLAPMLATLGCTKVLKPVITCLINRTTGKKIRLLLPQSHVNFIGPCLIFNSVLFFAEYIYMQDWEKVGNICDLHICINIPGKAFYFNTTKQKYSIPVIHTWIYWKSIKSSLWCLLERKEALILKGVSVLSCLLVICTLARLCEEKTSRRDHMFQPALPRNAPFTAAFAARTEG